MQFVHLSCLRPTSLCARGVLVGGQARRFLHTTQGDLTKFVPNVSQVSPNPSTSTALIQRKPAEYYASLFEDYSKQGVLRFKALKQHASNIAPERKTENPQFLISNKIFEDIKTDLSKYNLEEVNPYLMMLESKSHEERVEAQRVICAVIKQAISKDEIEKSFDYFRLLQLSYLPVDDEVYALLRGKIKEAFIDLVNNKTSLPEVGTLNVIMDYLAETDRIPEAFSLLLSMKMAGMTPTAHTYSALLNACMKYEDTDDAMVAFDLMREDDIVLDYAYYDRLFQLCASSVYPLGTQAVLGEMCKRFMVPTAQRYLHKTTMYITEFMKIAGMKQSIRGRRGWVTGITIQTRLVFPPKTNYNRLLEPFSGEDGSEFLLSLANNQYGLAKLSQNNNNNINNTNTNNTTNTTNTTNNNTSLPFEQKTEETNNDSSEDARREALKSAGMM